MTIIQRYISEKKRGKNNQIKSGKTGNDLGHPDGNKEELFIYLCFRKDQSLGNSQEGNNSTANKQKQQSCTGVVYR